MSNVSHREATLVDLRKEPVTDLDEYSGIRSAFESTSVYDVKLVSGDYELVERALLAPFRKDYDELESPRVWLSDLRRTKSVVFSAFDQGRRIGEAIVAIALSGQLSWLDEPNVAALWDIRVVPTHRRKAVASSLLVAAEAWAQEAGCIAVRVETQNTNVPACKFYMRNGFSLQRAKFGAYAQHPEEVQFIWGKEFDG